MEVNDNPWCVETLDHFLYYVCPECPASSFKVQYDGTVQSKYDFVQHALEKHPSADGNIPIQELEEPEPAAVPEAPEQAYPEQAGGYDESGGYGGATVKAESSSSGGKDYAAAAVAGYNNYKMATAAGGPPPPSTTGPPKPKKRKPSGGAAKKSGGGGGPAGKKGQSAPAMPMKRPKLDTSSDDGPSLVGIDFPKMDDGRYACPWPGCGQILSNIGNTKRHYKQTHMEQQPQSCKVCHIELRNQAACDQHMKQTHNVTNKEIKMARFIPMSADDQMGLYILENGKSLCTSCSVAFSNIGNGKRHFNQVHLGLKGDTPAKPPSGSPGQLPPPAVKSEPTPLGYFDPHAPAPAAYPSTSSGQVTPQKPKPKPKPKVKPPVTPQKQLIKSESMPLVVQHDMGASPMEPVGGGTPFDAGDDYDAALAKIKFSKGDDGRWPCPWPGCGQTLSALSSVRRHYKSNHMEQQPQTCKVCHNEFKNQAACDNHMKQVHNITNKELKMAKFEPMSEDGLHGLYALENGKSLCSVCSTALSTVGSGKRHYKSVHLGIKQAGQGGLEPGQAPPPPSGPPEAGQFGGQLLPQVGAAWSAAPTPTHGMEHALVFEEHMKLEH